MAYLDYLASVFRHDRTRPRTFGVQGTFEVERMLIGTPRYGGYSTRDDAITQRFPPLVLSIG